jgi:hypothetical protein
MTACTGRPAAVRSGDRAAGPAGPIGPAGPVGPAGAFVAAVATVAALLLTGAVLTGCGVVKAVKQVTHDVEGNKAIIDTFTGRLKSGEATTFEARYVTTGSSPATVLYAVRPPADLAFSTTPAPGGSSADRLRVHLVMNSTGAYYCAPPAASGRAPHPAWDCQKLGTASAATRNKILGVYSPAHWVAFLKGFALAAGFAGDKVTTSSLTVNGFGMQCVDFRAAGVAGTSTICTTAQGILGYVKVATDPTSFQITAYSAAPPASLFALPADAKVTAARQRSK